jgi:hypothetical protein
MSVDSAAAAGAGAAADSAARQSRDDAWWTGPLLAPSASTLPRGHFLIEPYVFDSVVYAREDADGGKTRVPHEYVSGSLTYVLYGLTDRLTVGAIPRFGINHVIDGEKSGGVGVSDIVLQAQYRLALFHEGRPLPTISMAISESLPTGKFDQLRDRRSDALGSGAYTTTLSVYSQYFFWMPTGRILRTRLNVCYSMSSAVAVRDASVYGTQAGFRGRAYPGDSFVADSAWEYSVTRRWVPAVDFVYERDANTSVRGGEVTASSGPSTLFAVAPAIEHNWSNRVGMIVGARFVVTGRNTSLSVVPIAAINLLY